MKADPPLTPTSVNNPLHHAVAVAHNGPTSVIPPVEDLVRQTMVQGVEGQTGDEFFAFLVKHLASSLTVKYAYTSQYREKEDSFWSCAGWGPSGFLPSFKVPVGGPCEAVLQRQIIFHKDSLPFLYPHVQAIRDWDVHSYCGVPILDSSGQIAGHVAVLDDKPLPDEESISSIMRIFSVCAQAEIERRKLDQALKKNDLILQNILEGTASVLGAEFFPALVRHLATGLELRYAFVAECLPNQRARSLAFWQDGRLGENFEYDLTDTPCLEVVAGRGCFHPDSLPQLFPKDVGLIKLQAESYHGVPVLDSAQSVIGHLVVMDDRSMAPDSLRFRLLETFAMRAGAELERLRTYQEVQWLNNELRVLVDINRAIGCYLDRDELFGTVATCLKTLVPTERFGIELPIEGNKLQGHIFSHSPEVGESTQRTVLPAAGTACDWVIQNQQWYVVSSCDEVRAPFPVTFDVMSAQGMESLLTLPLVSGGRSRGAMYFMASAKGAYTHLHQAFFEQVAGAVAVALDNCLAHEELRQQASLALAESEERFRDLFDEAPIAYVHEGLDTKFIRANRTAMKILGITADQVESTYGRTFIPDTPDAQRRLKEAFASVGSGTDTSGVVLELRRKDTGKPLWIQWWSRPDPIGNYTRTMFIDITERVLMEQEKTRLEAQNVYLQEEIKTEHNFGEIIGNSAAIRKVLQAVGKVAVTDATVLLTGETGTGKELIARAIHDRSARRKKPLVKVNCAAIPTGLIESELFGHEKGAFTGALLRKIGRFEVANGGTIFLDEIGELPLDLQSKLLRVLQEGEFERVGSSQTQRVDVRVIAATNRDLDKCVNAGQFRADLFYRLNVFPIHLPPLRERIEDIPLLAGYLTQHVAAKLGKRLERIPHDVVASLERYHWPGNVRELEHVIERAVILTDGEDLVPVDWLNTPSQTKDGTQIRTLEEMERDHIVGMLERTNWQVSGEQGAATLLGLKPTTLEARMKKLGILRKKS